jgi:uncharacterized damage-inducible protein DinB
MQSLKELTMRTITIVACFALFLPASTQQTTEGQPEMWEEVREAYTIFAAYTEEKLIALAEAYPQDLYEWRPMEGVRSVSEVFLHIAAANYDVVQLLGGSLPDEVGDPWELESSTTDKSNIMAVLEKSFEFVNDYISTIPETEYNRMLDYYGMEMTVLAMIIEATGHQREHLGQQIAYARTNNIVPPWSVVE